MSCASSGSIFIHFHAPVLCMWPVSERASQTFRSGKNNVMRVLVRRILRAALSGAANERAAHRTPLGAARVGLLNRPHDQRADGSAGTFRAVTQPIMQRLGDIDSGADSHAMIMSQTTG